MIMTVWVDSWQMQCCGDPFRRGSKVTWTLRDADPGRFAAMLGPFVRRTVEAAEEHHGGVPEDTPPTTGTVTLIAAVQRTWMFTRDSFSKPSSTLNNP